MSVARFAYEWSAPELRPDVVTYWEVSIDGSDSLKDLMLPAWPTIRIVLSGDWSIGPEPDALPPVPARTSLHGITHKADWVHGSPGRAFNIVLYPRGWYQHVRGNGAAYEGRLVPLEEVIGTAAAELEHAVLAAGSFEERVAAADAFLLKRQKRRTNIELAQKIAGLTFALTDPACNTLPLLAERVGLQPSVVKRIMARHFGCSPKKLIRRQRFLRMLYTMEARPYGEWVDFIDPQYTDQSHMIRDFQYYLGISPGQYFDGDRPMLKPAADAIRAKLLQASHPLPPLPSKFLADREG